MPSAALEVSLQRPCELCGSPKGLKLSDKGRGGASFRTVICPSCGLVFSDPIPHDVKEFYEKDYRLQYKGSYIPKLKHVLRSGLIALDRVSRLGEFFPKSAAALDIGSGGGEFVHLLRFLGLRAKGVEPNFGFAEYSRSELGLDVSTSFIQDASFPEGSFDVVTVWHVLEHTEFPLEVLRRLSGLLADSGRLIVEVPNVKAVCLSPSGAFHVAHLYNFSVETLSAMMVKASLSPLRSFLSADTGNLTIIAAKSAPSTDSLGASDAPNQDAPAPAAYDGPAEAREVQKLVLGRSNLGYVFSRWAIQKAWRRLFRTVMEKLSVLGVKDVPGARRGVLEKLYRERAGEVWREI